MYQRRSSNTPRMQYPAQQYNMGNTAQQYPQNGSPTAPIGFAPPPAPPTQPQNMQTAQTYTQPYPAQPQTPLSQPVPAQPPTQRPPARQSAAGNANPQFQSEEFIDTKITKVNAKNKVMDLADALIKALPKDYANIHGVGGSKHAANSGIRLTLCDYSKGKGDASVTVRYNIDVRDIDRLLCIVSAAINGTLGIKEQMKAIRDFANAHGMVIGWLHGNHQPTLQELAGLQQTLCNGLMQQDPDNIADRVVWSWDVQKNNPHKSACKWIDGVEYTPVSTINLTYNPSKNYAWMIKVANYMAPINRQANGASSHNNKGAIEKKEVMFSITTDDLFYALCDVHHYIALWETRMFRTVDAMCSERERRAESKRNQQSNP